MVENSQENYKQAAFNSSISILLRVDRLWSQAHQHCSNGMYEKWATDLDRLFIEFYADAKEEDLVEVEKLNKEILKIGFHRHTETGRLKNLPELYKTIFQKEMFLKKLEQKQGRGLGYEDDIEDYMD